MDKKQGMIKVGVALAAATGITMAITKFLLAEDFWWPFVVPEYIAAALLISGAALLQLGRGGVMFGAGWGATAMLSWTTLSHHLESSRSFLSAGPIEYALLGLLALSCTAIAFAPKGR